jgi:hypothetical protein
LTTTPGPASCREIEGTCLELTFHGDSCTYEGPNELKAGQPVTLLFLNKSDMPATMNLVRHTGDETIQDMKDVLVDEPYTGKPPMWALSIPGAWKLIRAGESRAWEGVLKPAIHTIACVQGLPMGVWFGAGLSVEE